MFHNIFYLLEHLSKYKIVNFLKNKTIDENSNELIQTKHCL